MINRSAAVGVQRSADSYERARPSYPAAFIDALPLAGARVVDLAAGTGKLTRLLVAAGGDVVAVERVDAMSAVDWPGTIAASGLVTPAQVVEFEHARVDADLVVDRAMSTSYISAGSEETRAAVAAEVRALVADLPPRFDFPHVTTMFTCRRA